MHGSGYYSEQSKIGNDMVTWYIVMDEMQSSLHDWIYKFPSKLTLGTIFRIALETAEALYFLHHCKIIHRDIKPANILVCSFYFVFLVF